ncbi:unnamed protein product [Candidula unifasciata]|uniref:EXPERA domain-containing protein n=1 Tax=Candidula unifasciata TaxID=100452 RepID=A0A8S3Z1M6_9EUPU|nr:unnamed protein product [Candidula unifasciata]
MSGAAVVFLTSLSALPVSYIWDTIAHLKDQRLIFLTSCISFGVVTAVPYFVLRKKVQKVDQFLLCLLLFQSVLSLAIAMENDGLIAEFLGYYLREGEPYLKTAHGTMISYWDGIAHYGMYLMMLAAVSWNQSFHDVGLYWAGSFAYSKLVLILAVLIGKEGARLPFLLHFPILAICAVMLMRFLSEKLDESCQIQRELNKEGTRKVTTLSIWKRPFDLTLFVYYGFASCFTLFRFSAAMGSEMALAKWYCEKLEPYLTDPLPYARTQLMVQTFYFVPYNVLSMYSLVRMGQAWVTRWSLVYAGAAAQGQFSFMGSSFHYRTPYIHRLPQTGSARLLFWIFNGLLFAVPQVAAYRCLNNPNFYLQQQEPEPVEHVNSVVGNGASLLSAKKIE